MRLVPLSRISRRTINHNHPHPTASLPKVYYPKVYYFHIKNKDMVICFDSFLPDFITKIKDHTYQQFQVHTHHQERLEQDKEILQKYHDAKWVIVDLINQHYHLPEPINLYNWLHHNQNDEVAFFLSEAGSSTLAL